MFGYSQPIPAFPWRLMIVTLLTNNNRGVHPWYFQKSVTAFAKDFGISLKNVVTNIYRKYNCFIMQNDASDSRIINIVTIDSSGFNPSLAAKTPDHCKAGYCVREVLPWTKDSPLNRGASRGQCYTEQLTCRSDAQC